MEGEERAAEDIGSRLRAARQRLGWSRETLAHHSSISWSAIAQIESGRRRHLRPGTLAALASVLQVSIDYLVAGQPAAPPMLEHRAVLYGSLRDFLSAVIPFLEEASERSEPALVVTSAAHARALRNVLDVEVEGWVDFVDRAGWRSSPAALIDHYTSYLDRSVSAGACWIRIVAEPSWERRRGRRAQTWAQYESLLNLMFSAAPVRLLCPYDTRSIEHEICAQAKMTHL